jgi:ankyrin repeat protein
MLVALALSSLTSCGKKHDTTAGDHSGRSEIHDAAKRGDLEKVKALLKDNPNLVSSRDTNGWMPLHAAASNGHKDVVELLLANKAEVNAKNTNGATPLHLAASAGHKDVAELLRQHGGLE